MSSNYYNKATRRSSPNLIGNGLNPESRKRGRPKMGLMMLQRCDELQCFGKLHVQLGKVETKNKADPPSDRNNNAKEIERERES